MGNGTDRERTPTVLVVDDEPLICSLASDCLRDAGYRTLEAHNARQAIDLLEKGEHADVVFQTFKCPEWMDSSCSDGSGNTDRG